MQILASGTRDVQVLAPFRCLGSLATFDNSVSIGSSLASSVNCLGITGGATVGGTLAALGNVNVNGILKAPQIRVTGTDDGVTIQNTDGTEVAKFHNDFRCRMNGNTSVLGDLSVTGSLTASGPLTVKPYISLCVSNTGGTLSTVSGSTTTLGTPGTVSLTHLGFNQTAVCTRGTPGNTNYFLYTFTWTGAHPQGSNFAVGATYNTGSTGATQPIGIITANATNSTQITLWIRTTIGTVTNVLMDGNFYVYSIP